MLFAGLMSGTSRDGIDAVVVDIGSRGIEILASISHTYDRELQAALATLVQAPDSAGLAAIGELHARIGDAFAEAAQAVIEKSGARPSEFIAIGSHGQTVYHAPDAGHPFSLQIGDASRIARRTGIPTVADFRSADIAAGGQGAPLVPPFHQWMFGKQGETTAIVNIGGIANATIVSDDQLLGFDTGPGNTLLDAWIQKHSGESFDQNGNWSASGSVNAERLAAMLADEYFGKTPPKSTGFEYFNLQWLEPFADGPPEDTQATLVELTVRSIADAVSSHAPDTVLVCGGGVHNSALMKSLRAAMGDCPVHSTAVRGLDPDLVEACAFAWLARRRISGLPGNAPSVTGASSAVSLGAVYQP